VSRKRILATIREQITESSLRPQQLYDFLKLVFDRSQGCIGYSHRRDHFPPIYITAYILIAEANSIPICCMYRIEEESNIRAREDFDGELEFKRFDPGSHHHRLYYSASISPSEKVPTRRDAYHFHMSSRVHYSFGVLYSRAV
jgi:hypothetical protein